MGAFLFPFNTPALEGGFLPPGWGGYNLRFPSCAGGGWQSPPLLQSQHLDPPFLSPPQACGHPAFSSLPRSRTFQLWLRHQYFHPHNLLSSLVQHILLTLFVLVFFSLKQHLPPGHVDTLMPFSARLFFFEAFLVERHPPQAPAMVFAQLNFVSFFPTAPLCRDPC